jgi:hypothetical protein
MPQMKEGPGIGPAPRRWVMVGCLQGKTMTGWPLKVNKRLRPGKVPVIYPQDEFMEATPGIEPG